jgi:zinc transport system ATP-binding protein
VSDPAQAVVEVRDVTFGYGRRPVLEAVSLDLYAHDYLAILGPNGGGKTTLLKVLLGLVKPWRGTVRWKLPHGARRLGYVPQFSTFEAGVPLRVEEVARMGRLGMRGMGRWYRDADREATRKALEAVRLEDRAGELAGTLSGGQVQRLLLARALAGEPEAIFLDEPMASLDADSRRVVREILLDLRQRMPVVVVTHDPAAIAGEIRHIACLNRRLTYHGDEELTPAVLEETYGCPVELIAHGVPHRVLPGHSHAHGHSPSPGPSHE